MNKMIKSKFVDKFKNILNLYYNVIVNSDNEQTSVTTIAYLIKICKESWEYLMMILKVCFVNFLVNNFG
jgi:hypothetical protein